MVDEDLIRPREWIQELFTHIQHTNSFAVIITANAFWATILDLYAKKYDLPLENTLIIWNAHQRHEDWTLGHEQEPVITSANKHTLSTEHYSQELIDKLTFYTHWVVIGDSLWDLWMQYLIPFESVTTIWFASSKKRDAFEHVFDHVLDDRASFNEVLSLLK